MIFGERRRYRAMQEDGDRRRPSLSGFRQWSLNNSNSSTMTVEEPSKFVVDEVPRQVQPPPPPPSQQPRVYKKRVTFSESIQVDDSKANIIYDDEMDNLWFTDDQMDEMFDEFMDTAELLRTKGRKKTYVKSIQRTFASLSDVFTTADDIFNLMNDASTMTIRADRLGMERHVIDPDERQRLKSLVRQRVLYWQTAADLSDEERAEKMRAASRNTGRAFVVFAYLVAERSALLED